MTALRVWVFAAKRAVIWKQTRPPLRKASRLGSKPGTAWKESASPNGVGSVLAVHPAGISVGPSQS